MSYYQFNRQETMQKANKNCSKEKTDEYYLLNKEVIEKKQVQKYDRCRKTSKKRISKKLLQQI